MEDRVQIVSMKLAHDPGALLASFDANVNGMAFRRCGLIRTDTGHVIAVPPRAVGDTVTNRAVMFTSHGLKQEFLRKARATYESMGDKIVENVVPGCEHVPRDLPQSWLRGEVVAAG